LHFKFEIILNSFKFIDIPFKVTTLPERIKKNLYGNNPNSTDNDNADKVLGVHKSYYFWRTNEPSPKEYDLIEERDGAFQVFEIKWAKSKAEKVKTCPVFFDTFKNSTLEVIHSENWTDWLV
jgi:hypothetical protein